MKSAWRILPPTRYPFHSYKNLYTILGIRETPIIIPMMVIPTGKSTSRLLFKVVVIGASISAVNIAKPPPLSAKLKPSKILKIPIINDAEKNADGNRYDKIAPFIQSVNKIVNVNENIMQAS